MVKRPICEVDRSKNMTFPFCKFHGFGNDYIVIEQEDLPADMSLRTLAKEMCHRHTGVGSDGIALLSKLDGVEADFHCEIINPDGSLAGFSGNGTRCAVAYLHFRKVWTSSDLRLATPSGIKKFNLIDRLGDETYWFNAEIGKPQFGSDQVPVILQAPRPAVVNEQIEIEGRVHSFSAVNVGNPVACIYVETFDFDWRNIGRLMEHYPVFPDGVNVVFVHVLDRGNIEIRIWERGAGETSSSGTCSSGAAVLSSLLLKTGRSVNVHSPGGTTKVVWRDDDEMILTGRADLAFCGEWPVT